MLSETILSTHEIEPLQNANLQMYPNPGHNEVTVGTLNGISISSISFYNITGARMLEKSNINSYQENVNVTALEKGMYYVEILTEEKTRHVVKWIKE